MSHTITWFELPAADLDRAVDFYRAVLQAEIRKEIFGKMPNGIFVTASRAEVTGALVQGEGYVPSSTGAVVYLNARTPDDLDQILARVEPSGGKVILPKTDIGEPGFIALILDSEGNRVGLHASPHR
jgi:predicted enzyme related to lactoylglutathione lyase